jgi:hypothetical protein
LLKAPRAVSALREDGAFASCAKAGPLVTFAAATIQDHEMRQL